MFKIFLGVDEIDITEELRENSLSIENDLDDVSTCSFELLTSINRDLFTGEKIIIEDSSEDRHFGGVIEDYNKTEIHGNRRLFLYQIDCVDYNYLALKRLLGKVYVEEQGGDIVRDFIAEKLHEEGVEEGHIEDGPLVTKGVFNYVTFEEALDEMATLTGYIWDIDYYKKLHYFARDYYRAPFSITQSNDNFNTLSVSRTKEQYRNHQMIRGGKDTTNPQTVAIENVQANRRNFQMDYPVAETPKVWVNGEEKTVGIRQVDSGRDFYWQVEDATITRDRNLPDFEQGDTVEIEYIGYFPINTIAQLEGDRIRQRRQIEEGSGIYEDVITDRSVSSQTHAEEKAIGLLRKHGRIPRIVHFETDRVGLRAGQLIRIDLPDYNLDDDFLIRNVSASDINGQIIRYEVEALDGRSLGSWKQFFKDLARQGRDFAIAENEVVTYLRMFEDDTICKDDFEIDTDALEHRLGYGQIGFVEVK